MRPDEIFRKRFEEAARLHQGGQRQAAISAYRQLRISQPHFPPLLNLLALALAQEGSLQDGLSLAQEATKRAPDFPDAWLNLGFIKRELGDQEGAMACYRRVLFLRPKDLSALLSLASIQTDLDEAEAVKTLQGACQLAPGRALPLLRLRRLYRRMKNEAGQREIEARLEGVRLSGAEELYEAALIRLEQRRLREVIQLLERVLQAQPNHISALTVLAGALRDSGETDKAVEVYRRLGLLTPNKAGSWIQMGMMLAASGRTQEALKAYDRALEIEPDNKVAPHMRDAALGKQTKLSPMGYVQKTFDDFSSTFNQVLVQDLEYRAPDLIRERLAQLAPARVFGRFLDIGCGTGLVAEALRAMTRERIGVDLSPKMAKKAQETGLYAAVEVADALAWLERAGRFELIVAADVFVYVGELEPYFQAASQGLEPGGLFVFTTERLEAAAGSYWLQPSGRYAHDDGYLLGLGERFGLACEARDAIPLRKELGRMLPGSLFVFRKRA